MTIIDARPAGGRAVSVRRLEAGDDERIAALFDATLRLGHPVPDGLAGLATYRDLCLGWYLGPGRADAAVALWPSESGVGEVVGYALLCTDEAGAARWARRAVPRLLRELVGDTLRGRFDRPSRRFHRGRARDGLVLLRARRSPPATVHAHLNVAGGRRHGAVTLALVAHVDDVARAAGADAWYGEMNERVGRRSRALERLGFEVVHRDRNHTLTSLLDEPVDRLTIVRRFPPPPECELQRDGSRRAW